LATLCGRKIIDFLQKKQIGETVRDLGLEGQMAKKGTPTMGGIIIIIAILIPTLLVTNLTNIYILLMIITTLWLGIIGFLDDYIKVFLKNKEGLSGKSKIVGQVGLGLIVGLTMYFSPDIVIRENMEVKGDTNRVENVHYAKADVKSTKSTIPFFKNNNLNYADAFKSLGDRQQIFGWILFVLVVILIVTAVSNGANITDGLDGLAIMPVMIAAGTLGVIAYTVGRVDFAQYLGVNYVAGTGELLIFVAALIGGGLGFLWYNAPPAAVFMGDTGSLALGGALGAIAVVTKHEIVLAIVGGLFVVEAMSVIIQVLYFKRTGRRVFLMAPIHHHFEKKGWAEPQIVIRFWIISLILALIGLATLKLR